MQHKPTMTSRQWLVALAVTVAAVGIGLMAFNYVMDPFGAFGDRFFQWWSYNETMNPRVAKLSYLEQNHDEYDSYIIGCSSTSSYPVEALNEYYDASFYNLIMYGADMQDLELTCRYLVEHYEVKNLIVNLYINNAETYGTEPNPRTYNLHYKVDGSSALEFYGKYLLANPQFAATKLEKYLSDGYVQKAHDVFNEQTGAYDKSLRDVENISNLESYLEKYPGFTNYPSHIGSIDYLDECMESLRAIRTLCQEHDIHFQVVCPPMYHENFNYYTMEQMEAFCKALADVTPYWDFTLSSVSFEPRYFYDETHFRNDVGRMALAKIFGDDSVYIPEDFGFYVTPETVDDLLESYRTAQIAEEETYTHQVPILMYHHLSETQGSGDTITVENFRSHMQALSDAGYTAVDFTELKAYVEQGCALPEKAVVITFDDGYESNLSLAAPILREFNMKATVFAIGVSIGKDTYKDTGVEMIPHFSLEDALACNDVISVQSHGYDIHQVEGRDPEPIRQGVLQMEKETEEAYIEFLREDCRTMDELFLGSYGTEVGVLAYPHGLYSDLSEVVVKEEGIWATVTSEPKVNTIVKGLPQCLMKMGRFSVSNETTSQQILEWVGTK